jgi:hypothetical protein
LTILIFIVSLNSYTWKRIHLPTFSLDATCSGSTIIPVALFIGFTFLLSNYHHEMENTA